MILLAIALINRLAFKASEVTGNQLKLSLSAPDTILLLVEMDREKAIFFVVSIIPTAFGIAEVIVIKCRFNFH